MHQISLFMFCQLDFRGGTCDSYADHNDAQVMNLNDHQAQSFNLHFGRGSITEKQCQTMMGRQIQLHHNNLAMYSFLVVGSSFELSPVESTLRHFCLDTSSSAVPGETSFPFSLGVPPCIAHKDKM